MSGERGIPKDLLVGAERKPDGTLDTSKAATWKRGRDVLAENEKFREERRRVELAGLNEEETAKTGPGTAGSVHDRLMTAIRINEKMKKDEPNQEDKLNSNIKLLELQLELLSDAKKSFKKAGKDAEKISASEMSDKVEEMIADWENLLVANKGKNGTFPIQTGDFKTINSNILEQRLKAAKELRSKLMSEVK